MATLRQSLKYLDFIMNRQKTEEVYMILHEDLHNVWVIKDGGGEPPKEMPKHMINFTFIKIDPKVAKVLYGDAPNENLSGNSDTTVQSE